MFWILQQRPSVFLRYRFGIHPHCLYCRRRRVLLLQWSNPYRRICSRPATRCRLLATVGYQSNKALEYVPIRVCIFSLVGVKRYRRTRCETRFCTMGTLVTAPNKPPHLLLNHRLLVSQSYNTVFIVRAHGRYAYRRCMNCIYLHILTCRCKDSRVPFEREAFGRCRVAHVKKSDDLLRK